MATKLREVKGLTDGWWGPGSRAVDHALIELVEATVAEAPWLAERAALAPTPQGSLVLEWQTGDHFYTVEISDDGRMELSDDNSSTDEFSSVTVDADLDGLLKFAAESGL